MDTSLHTQAKVGRDMVPSGLSDDIPVLPGECCYPFGRDVLMGQVSCLEQCETKR